MWKINLKLRSSILMNWTPGGHHSNWICAWFFLFSRNEASLPPPSLDHGKFKDSGLGSVRNMYSSLFSESLNLSRSRFHTFQRNPKCSHTLILAFFQISQGSSAKEKSTQQVMRWFYGLAGPPHHHPTSIITLQ